MSSTVADFAAPGGPIESLSSSIRDWLGKLAETTGLSPSPLPYVFAPVFMWLLTLHFLLFTLSNNTWINNSKNINRIVDDAYAFIRDYVVRVLLSYSALVAGYMSAGGGLENEIGGILNVLNWMVVAFLVYLGCTLLTGNVYTPGAVSSVGQDVGRPLKASSGGFLKALYFLVAWIGFLSRQILFDTNAVFGSIAGGGVFSCYMGGLVIGKIAGR